MNDQLSQHRIKSVLRVRSVEPMVAMAPAHNQSSGLQLRQFVLHCLQGEKAQPRQLTHIQLLKRIGEQEPQNLRSHDRKQSV